MTIRSWSDGDIPFTGSWGGVPILDSVPGGSGSIVTFGHDLRNLGKFDCGGPFLLQKFERFYTFGSITYGAYSGQTCSKDPPSMPSASIPGTSALEALGTTAIARTTPTNPVFEASTFMGETLQDGMPGVIGMEAMRAKTLKAKQAGSEYLNVEFGWLPLVSDVRSFAYAVRNSSRIINKFKRESGHLIHRRFEFPPTEEIVAVVSNQFIKTPGTKSVGSSMEYRGTSKRQKTWFSGAYKYYLPVGDDSRARFQRYGSYANKLLGLRLTPETLWNIAPWSWAVDWKTDVGDVIHNQSALGHDSLVLAYGYLMHSLITESYSVSSKGYGEHVERRTYLRRIPATPYGFGVDMSKLSSTQVSVLAALGMSRR